MIWVGSMIDRVDVRLYATTPCLAWRRPPLSLSFAPNLLVLDLSLFALRLFGQGMLSHAGVMSTARLHEGVRGRALGVAALGFPAGEATLPGLALALIAAFGWTGTWRIAALVLVAALAIGWLLGFLPRAKDARPRGTRPKRSARASEAPRWRDILQRLALSRARPHHDRLSGDHDGLSSSISVSSPR